MANTKPKVQTERLALRVEPDFLGLLDSLKESRHESRASVIRRLVLEATALRAPEHRRAGGARG